MSELTTASKLTIIGLALTVLSFFGKIGWDYYQSRSELIVELTELSPIISQQKNPVGLVVTYGAQRVFDLNRATFVIKNSGRTVIQGKDVVSPIYIQLAGQPKAIEATIVDSDPHDNVATATLDREANRITFKFDLMNPGDSFQLSLLTQAPELTFTAGGRVAGLQKISISKNIPRNEIRAARQLVVYVWAFLGVATAAWMTLTGKRRELQHLALQRVEFFHYGTRQEVREKLKQLRVYFSKRTYLQLVEQINSLPDTQDPDLFGFEFREQLNQMIYQAAGTKTARWPEEALSMAILLTGLAMSIATLFWG